MDKLRLDKYLWAIRLFKTRTQAAEAIQSGRVCLNGDTVKPSKNVLVGELYEVKTEGGLKLIEVSALLDERKKFTEAIKYYTDHTPVTAPVKSSASVFLEYTGKRHSKQGRPTKKNRRSIERFL